MARRAVRLWNPAVGGANPGAGTARRRAKRVTTREMHYVYPPNKADSAGHYPIYDAKHARNALARSGAACNRGTQTAWQKSRNTTAQAVHRRVVREVQKAFPEMEVAGVRRNPFVQIQSENPARRGKGKAMPRTRRRGGRRRTPPRIKTGPRKGQFRKRKGGKRRRRRGTGAITYQTPTSNPNGRRRRRRPDDPPRRRRRPARRRRATWFAAPRRRRRRRTAGQVSYQTPMSNPNNNNNNRNNNNRRRRSYSLARRRRSYNNPAPSPYAPFADRFMYAAQTGLASAGVAYGIEWLLFMLFRQFPQTRGKVFVLSLARFAAAAMAIGASRNVRGPVVREALQTGYPATAGYLVLQDAAARMGILTLPAWNALNAVTVASPTAQERIANDVGSLGVITAQDTAAPRRMRGRRSAGVITAQDYGAPAMGRMPESYPNSMAGLGAATVVA